MTNKLTNKASSPVAKAAIHRHAELEEKLGLNKEFVIIDHKDYETLTRSILVKEMLSPTVKVSLYGLHCYMNEYTGDVWATLPWLDWVIGVAVGFHNTISLFSSVVIPNYTDEGFPFKVLETYCDKNCVECSLFHNTCEGIK